MLIGLASEKFQEAKEASKRLQEVADAIHIGLVELKDGHIRDINRSAMDLLPKDMRSDEAMNEFLASSQEDGSRVIELDRAVVQLRKLPPSGSRNLVLVQDVTESFLMARKLKQRERLALLGQMTAQMAHQIKTPLAILAGQAQMLARRLTSDAELKDRAQGLYHEARDLARQVNEISTFYLERKPYLKMMDLHPVLNDLKKRLDSLSHSCEIEIECTEQIRLETDPGLLTNLLFLLGQNALSPEVGATHLSFIAEVEDEKATIRVQDNGAGVPEDMREKIFEPFASTKDEGLGLGLFLAKDLVQQMDGSIELKETDHGTSFNLSFPLRRVEQ